MKVNTPKEVLERLQQLLDEQWEYLRSQPQPDNERDWAKVHGIQEGLLLTQKILVQVYRENNYFWEEDK